jgi:cyanate permease
MSVLISSRFGLAAYGALYGMTSVALYLGNAIGPLIAGYSYDATGAYQGSFVFFLASYAITIPAMLVLNLPFHKLAGKLLTRRTA